MSPKESCVLILSFPSVWLCQVNSEKEETLTNPERPSRAEMEACPDGEAEGWAGMGAKDPTLAWRRTAGYAGLGEVMSVSWREKGNLGGGFPHLITQQESWEGWRLTCTMTPLNV